MDTVETMRVRAEGSCMLSARRELRRRAPHLASQLGISAEHANARLPTLSARVSMGQFRTVFNITRVSEKDVDLQLPGTNIERFRVRVDDLRYLDALKGLASYSYSRQIRIEIENEHAGDCVAGQNKSWLNVCLKLNGRYVQPCQRTLKTSILRTLS
jgi:hypothetical protein